MQDPWMERLSEYLDGELDRSDRETLEAHLQQCAECARVLEDLGKVRAQAREMPRPPAPAELWPRIEKAIAEGGVARPGAESDKITLLGPPRRTRFFSLPELLAACLAVAILSAGSVFLVLRHHEPAAGTAPAGTLARGPEVKSDGAEPKSEASEERRAEPPASVAAVPAERTGPEASLAAQTPETPKEEAISELRKALARERDRLDPTTIRTLEANLAIIDLAIDQGKRALAADPADSYVKQHLAETMRRRVELLQRATMLASTSSSEGPR
jgi:hypothetical protein